MDYSNSLTNLINKYGLSILDNPFFTKALISDDIKAEIQEKRKLEILFYLVKEYHIHQVFRDKGYDAGIMIVKNVQVKTTVYSKEEFKAAIKPLVLIITPEDFKQACKPKTNNQVQVNNKQHANNNLQINNQQNKVVKPKNNNQVKVQHNNANKPNNNVKAHVNKNINNINNINNANTNSNQSFNNKYLIMPIITLALLFAELVLMWFYKKWFVNTIIVCGLSIVLGIIFNGYKLKPIREILDKVEYGILFLVIFNIMLSGCIVNGYNFLILIFYFILEILIIALKPNLDDDYFVILVLILLVSLYVVGLIEMIYHMICGMSGWWILFFFATELVIYPFLIYVILSDILYADLPLYVLFFGDLIVCIIAVILSIIGWVSGSISAYIVDFNCIPIIMGVLAYPMVIVSIIFDIYMQDEECLF